MSLRDGNAVVAIQLRRHRYQIASRCSQRPPPAASGRWKINYIRSESLNNEMISNLTQRVLFVSTETKINYRAQRSNAPIDGISAFTRLCGSISFVNIQVVRFAHKTGKNFITFSFPVNRNIKSRSFSVTSTSFRCDVLVTGCIKYFMQNGRSQSRINAADWAE